MPGPKKHVAFTFGVALMSQASPMIIKTTPTLAATGDITVSIDGGNFANIGTVPTQIQATGVLPVTLTLDEMNGDVIYVLFHDAAGAEWQDLLVVLNTETGTLSEIDTALDTNLNATVSSRAAPGAEMDLVDAPNSDAVAAINGSVVNTLADMMGDTWTNETLVSIKDAVDLRLLESTYVAPPAMITAQEVRDAMKLAPTALPADAAGSVDKHLDDIDGKTVNLPASPAAVGSAMTLATGAITAAVIATGAIDADAIAADAGVELGTAAWTHTPRTLTQSAASVTATVTGSTLSIRAYDHWVATLSACGSVVGRTGHGVILTVKASKASLDSAALLQISELDGLMVLNGAVAVTSANGSLTVDDATDGDITLMLKAAVTAVLATPQVGLYYDVKWFDASGFGFTLTEGTVDVTETVTKAVA